MPAGHKKKPFSTKQKKEQLRAKNEKKRAKYEKEDEMSRTNYDDEGITSNTDNVRLVNKMNHQPDTNRNTGYDPNKYRLHFAQDSAKQIQLNKQLATEPIECLPLSACEVRVDEIYNDKLSMPQRPKWDYSMSKEQLEAKEEQYFKQYLDEQIDGDHLTYMELNLQTWRQLWRVLEMSDIILMVVDVRHSGFHFCPSLYRHVSHELGKPLIVVLNKIDMVEANLVLAWIDELRKNYPNIESIVGFSSFPLEKDADNLIEEMSISSTPLLLKLKRKGVFTTIGPLHLLDACEKLVGDKVDLSIWRRKIQSDINDVELLNERQGMTDKVNDDELETVHIEHSTDHSYKDHKQFSDGMLTLGCCGYPNVGKSSLINGLIGHKVVSVSKTPGHTKHFQTIFLCKNVKLCDSPGLVFPSYIHKSSQILAGIYPIAQVREPYSVIRYLYERYNIVYALKLQHPDLQDIKAHERSKCDRVFKWSAYNICESWALQRGYFTAKASRPDIYRAANSILRLAVTGRLNIFTIPPGYADYKDSLSNDERKETILKIQRAVDLREVFSSDDSDSDDSSSLDTDDDEGGGGGGHVILAKNPFDCLEEDE